MLFLSTERFGRLHFLRFRDPRTTTNILVFGPRKCSLFSFLLFGGRGSVLRSLPPRIFPGTPQRAPFIRVHPLLHPKQIPK